MGGEKERLERFYYILSSDSISNVNTRHSLSVEPSPTPDSHVIKVFMTTPPGISASVDPTSHYLDATLKILKSMAGASSFTIYCPIVHELMFGIVDEVSEMALTTNNINFSMEKCRVHEFREPYDCRAVVTNLGEVVFPADQYFKTKKLNVVESQKEWVSKVLDANAMANLYFLRPVSFGTSLSNILVPPVKVVSEWRKDTTNFVGEQGFDSIYSSETRDQSSTVYRPLSKSGNVSQQAPVEKKQVPKGIVPLREKSRGGKPPSGMVFVPKVTQEPPAPIEFKYEPHLSDIVGVDPEVDGKSSPELSGATTTTETSEIDPAAILIEDVIEGHTIDFEGEFN